MAASNQIALVFRNAKKYLWSGKGKRKGKIRKNNTKRSSRAKRIKTLNTGHQKNYPYANIWNQIRYNEGNIIGKAKELKVSSLSPSILIAFLG